MTPAEEGYVNTEGTDPASIGEFKYLGGEMELIQRRPMEQIANFSIIKSSSTGISMGTHQMDKDL